MDGLRIEKDMNIVKVLTAQAKGERVESDKLKEINDEIGVLLSDMNPMNRHMIAQLISYGVTELNKTTPNFIDTFADVKRVGFGDKAEFKAGVGRIKAVIQATGATTPRSRVANKKVTLDTISVSARPSVSLIEVLRGEKNMADLIRSAQYEMDLVKLGHIVNVLKNGVSAYGAPFYGTGNGVVASTLDPMLMNFRRQGAVTMLGDPAITDRVALLAGFTNAGATVYGANTIDDYHKNGVIGSYRGVKVNTMLNPPVGDGKTLAMDPALLYIMALGMSNDARCLKVLEEGNMIVNEATNIDDLSFDVRLDQLFGAAYIVGDVPTMAVYEDTSL